ncbi:MAG: class I SAM-dependent RNA methyltransferase [Clostridiaceae bacterium]|nr:class I SAM-dependent RNA methyltransferase [Clostridiaceae bacterium]MDY3071291.1 class I SAM-dependent RNA methyltransferase [Eubacteriales bacterium]MDY5016794.1 class I SAM-dependent RNA methyltransferase [Eubacteriales bacterium]
MDELTFAAPCLFGIEGVAADELRRLGFANVAAADGRVTFSGSIETLAAANIRSRYTERILLELARFPATTFTQLFDGVKAAPWERFLPRDAAFPVDGYSVHSKLASVPDCQKIIKKAVVTALQQKHGVEWFPETGATYKIRFSILRDEVSVGLDTSGEGLHKRGYREIGNAAPLKETLGCAMVDLARYRGRDPFLDPFCGSGTIAIEAALKAINRAPGISRTFAAEKWAFIPEKVWKDARDAARDDEWHTPPGALDIEARDIDPACVELARSNARKAGVADHIRFSVADACEPCGFDGVIVTNPPYGERLGDQLQARTLYAAFGKAVNPRARLYVISSDAEFERSFGRRAAKKRKLYNGMIKCNLYMYF